MTKHNAINSDRSVNTNYTWILRVLVPVAVDPLCTSVSTDRRRQVGGLTDRIYSAWILVWNMISVVWSGASTREVYVLRSRCLPNRTPRNLLGGKPSQNSSSESQSYSSIGSSPLDSGSFPPSPLSTSIGSPSGISIPTCFFHSAAESAGRIFSSIRSY